MEWITRYQAQRAEHWPEVEAFFGALPPEQFRQGVVLRHDLASLFSETGQFVDFLSRPTDPPWLYLHFWLLDDWRFPEGEARRALERGLFLAMAATACAVYARQAILDEDSGLDSSYADIEQALNDEAAAQLARLFPPESPFWEHHRQFTAARAHAMTHSVGDASATSSPDAMWRRLADQLALAKLPAAAVALQSGGVRASQLDALYDVMDQLNASLQTLAAILALPRDARRGRLSYPIARTMQAAGLAPGQAVTTERLLGAALLTGSLREIADECIARLGACRTTARGLSLPTLAAYLAAVEDRFRELAGLFSVEGAAAGEPHRSRLRFASAPDSLTQALAMAEGYLLSDRTFRESWEVQRRGLFGASELVGRVFAPGLILEALCPHRDDLGRDVSAMLETLAQNGFRYYPHPAVPPDADDLGLALRLCCYAADEARHRQQLEKPLRWMAANISEIGQIACWFTRGVEGLDESIQTALWGNACATVEANLLLGLMAYDSAAYQTVVEQSAAQWLARWLAAGLGANAHYVSAYALWAVARLLRALSSLPGTRLSTGLALASLAGRLRQEANQAMTPQAAAFLTLACLEAPASQSAGAELFDPAWITLMLKRQRYDGGWDGEPLFIVPTRGEVAAWYSSNSVTAAYCYHALKSYDRLRQA